MFDPDTLYLPSDPAIRVLGAESTLATWRSQGVGPAYLKLGGRIAYRGSDLNEWIESRRIQTAAA